MSRLTKLVLALCTSSIALMGLLVVPARADTTSAHRSLLVGELGIEGGAAPGGFRPTAGSVEVAFYLMPLVLETRVGSSGRFQITLTPGKYTVIGCGPSASGTPGNQCSQPLNVDLAPGEVDRIRLVWLRAP